MGKIARAGINPADHAVQFGCIVVSILQGAADTFFRVEGDAVVDHIDDATDSAPAVEQRRRPAQYLNAVRKQWFHANGVVGTEAGYIRAAGAVLQGDVSCTLLATNYRPAYAGAERRIGDAGFVTQCFADARSRCAVERVAGEYGYRKVGFRPLQRFV